MESDSVPGNWESRPYLNAMKSRTEFLAGPTAFPYFLQVLIAASVLPPLPWARDIAVRDSATPSRPFPPDNSSTLAPWQSLGWERGLGVARYDVYLWKAGE